MGQTATDIETVQDDCDQCGDAGGRLVYDSQQRCLCYLLPLVASRAGSTAARRLRLKQNLTGGTASHNAAVLAREPQFWTYLQQINLIAFEGEIDARRARHFINRACRVAGRHALDRDPRAAERFFRFVEQPFVKWLFATTPT